MNSHLVPPIGFSDIWGENVSSRTDGKKPRITQIGEFGKMIGLAFTKPSMA